MGSDKTKPKYEFGKKSDLQISFIFLCLWDSDNLNIQKPKRVNLVSKPQLGSMKRTKPQTVFVRYAPKGELYNRLFLGHAVSPFQNRGPIKAYFEGRVNSTGKSRFLE